MKSQTGIKRPPRRQHDREFKARLVRESLQAGASVAAIAMANGINANMLFKWRRERQCQEGAPQPEPAVLLPVRLASEGEGPAAKALPLAAIAPAGAKTTGVIELEIAGARLRLRGAVDEASLCSVLRALRQST
jgi:transposase